MPRPDILLAEEFMNRFKSQAQAIIDNVDYLIDLNRSYDEQKRRTKRIMDGGEEAVQELLGHSYAGRGIDPPFANLMINANTVLGQKLGRYPECRVEPPFNTDAERARQHAQIRSEIVNYLDHESKLKLRLPQAGRWIPGYGFAVFTIKEVEDRNGVPYPHSQLRDPYDTYPGPWGLDQQPQQVAFKYSLPLVLARRYFPQLNSEQALTKFNDASRIHGGLLLGGESGYEAQGNKEITFYEYMDKTGTYIVNLDLRQILSYIPNPIAPMTHFYVGRRYSFSKLTGALDHAIGLMGAMARLNILMITAMEDAVNAETNIFGEIQGIQYKRGRGKVNHFGPQTRVENPTRNMPHQIFQQGATIKDDARIMLRYPVTEDAQAPMSFITGRGVQELGASISQEVNEYLTVFEDVLEEIDYRRLRWIDVKYPNDKRTIEGITSTAAYATEFTPSIHIKGRYRTTRPYGLMASMDDVNRLLGMLHLMQNKIIDRKSVRENTDIPNVTKVEDRLRAQDAEDLAMELLNQMAIAQDPAAIDAIMRLQPEGEMKTILKSVLQQQKQAAPTNDPLAQMMGGIQGAPEDVNTALSRITNTGRPMMGSQSVTRSGG